MSKTALVTGATAGIGEATAIEFAKLGYNLILTGRRKDRLDKFKSQLESEYKVSVSIHAFDIRERRQVEDFCRNEIGDQQIDVLVNNAGLASGLAPLHAGDIEDWEKMIDTNVKGLLYITRELAPRMVDAGSGHIINVGSIAGVEVYPNGNVYCATKHAVRAISEGLRKELYDKGIRVTNIAPGLVETEFSIVRFHGDKSRADNVYQGMSPLTAEDIADCIAFVATRPPHVNIADMLILPSDQGSSTQVKRS
ncbi:MAG: SDR family oxidoreductase [Flavobacteriales bacterium]|nr:SDR family oxidoreductase [Flavobacteriales bacterium]MCB9191887.1 SDR family oxidoreductase [Flavobacteriales bacterium]MCB9204692.1 SDR family oxidoreductase [Flavobacteriales bacterium]